ncbi:S41 family peptidase [Elongatibacter sediminis]|uniref:S41 family peptidase n=1 Tax=Elongatibacter sediminis TaxID=3119006 RepID=A0AAW9RJ24_9GAMM
MHHPYRFVVLLYVVFAACCGFAPVLASDTDAGENTAPADASGAAQLTLDELRTFTDVFNQVRRNYVEPVDDRTLLRSAIEGMLADLDPHSAYLPRDDYADLENSSRGRYVGLGFDVRPEDGRLVVKQVISPSPADDAGINPGDIILAVNDVPIRGRPLQESIDAISGPEGSPVRLTLLRPDGERLELDLRRAFVKVPAMDFRLLDGHFGYFHLAFFHRDSATDLKNSIDSIRNDGIDLKGLILDLRNNPGGVLQPAIDIADGFLDSGTIVVTRGRDPSNEVSHAATPGQWLPGTPLVILMDRGSASASEVLAGALQDHGRALIIGERSFGKGSVQSVLSLRNGAGLKLTTARYYTPSGRSIQAEGIRPDQVAAPQMFVADIPDERTREADLERHLASDGSPPEDLFDTEAVSPQEDYPLFQAINVLRGARILSSAALGAPPAQK